MMSGYGGSERGIARRYRVSVACSVSFPLASHGERRTPPPLQLVKPLRSKMMDCMTDDAKHAAALRVGLFAIAWNPRRGRQAGALILIDQGAINQSA